jgi:alkylation response protein AidB-like acyl-CoA dehydrogenase
MTSDLNLLYTDVEDSLRSTVSDLLASRCPAESVIAMYDGDRSLVAPLWRSLAVDLGLAGLLVPEAVGGAGASAREAAVVLEELGRFVAPVPFLTSSVVATAVLAADPAHMGAVPAHMNDNGSLPGETPAVPAHVNGNGGRADDAGAVPAHLDGNGGPVSQAAADLLGDMAAGERTAALAVPLAASPKSFRPTLASGRGGLTGRVTSVAGVLDADVLLVPVAVPGGTGGGAGGGAVEVHLVETSAVAVSPVVSLDMSRQLADLSFEDVPSLVVVQAEASEAAVRNALQLGAALLASEQLGIAQWCLDTTVAYLKERRQFGRVVGGFQSLKHRLADLYTLVEQARAAARYSAAALAERDPDAEVAASVAQAYCSDVAVRAAEECVQLHGGIGMTWEHPAHLYLKRAKADQIAFGTPGAHRARLAELVDLPA